MRNWKALPIRGQPRVGLVISSFLGYPEPPVALRRARQLESLLLALQAQTWPAWRAVILHDGPTGAETGRDIVQRLHDTRIRYEATPQRVQQHGHPHRLYGLDCLPPTDYVGFTNDDAWYAPVYFEAMLAALQKPGKRLAYCNCVHSHRLWGYLDTKLKRKQIDIGGWLADREAVAAVPWTDYSFAGDWTFLDALTKSIGTKATVKVPHCLFVHN